MAQRAWGAEWALDSGSPHLSQAPVPCIYITGTVHGAISHCNSQDVITALMNSPVVSSYKHANYYIVLKDVPIQIIIPKAISFWHSTHYRKKNFYYRNSWGTQKLWDRSEICLDLGMKYTACLVKLSIRVTWSSSEMWGTLQRFRKENTQLLSKIFDGQKSEPMVSKAKLDLKVDWKSM